MAILLTDIHVLELRHKHSNAASVFQTLQQKITELHKLFDRTYLSHKDCAPKAIYEYGNKCPLLSQSEKKITRSYFPKVCRNKLEMVHSSELVASMCAYYLDLYNISNPMTFEHAVFGTAV